MERYRLVDGGQRLSVTFTWQDAKVFAKPHTYEFRYYRLPRISEPRIIRVGPELLVSIAAEELIGEVHHGQTD